MKQNGFRLSNHRHPFRLAAHLAEMPSSKITQDLIQIPAGVGNAYLVGNRNSFVLIDSGTQGNTGNILGAVEKHFGAKARPEAIVLTHGHFDHSGSAPELAEHWDVDVLAHRLELPYLGGRDSYPSPDPTVGGFMAQVIRFMPIKQPVIGSGHLHQLDPDDEIPGMEDWDIIETPGHSPGHVSFCRYSDRTLIAGDAFCTMNQDSMFDALSLRQIVSRPPSYYTIDWQQARSSVRHLAQLRPRVLAAGHGVPMSGEDATDQLRELARNFPIPEHGRYVDDPARADESGITYLPPPPPDPMKWVAVGIGAAAIAGTGFAVMRSRSRTHQNDDELIRRAA